MWKRKKLASQLRFLIVKKSEYCWVVGTSTKRAFFMKEAPFLNQKRCRGVTSKKWGHSKRSTHSWWVMFMWVTLWWRYSRRVAIFFMTFATRKGILGGLEKDLAIQKSSPSFYLKLSSPSILGYFWRATRCKREESRVSSFAQEGISLSFLKHHFSHWLRIMERGP